MEMLQVDAFTSEPFKGNPAAVCMLDRGRPDAWMQAVAAEMNLSETAFLLPQSDGFSLRWFTPATEVSLCGHATLASAHALWETGRLGTSAEARFHTKSGLLTARFEDGKIEMDFPARTVAPVSADDDLNAALGLGVQETAVVGQPISGSGPVLTCISDRAAKSTFLLLLKDEEAVRGLRPDFAALRLCDARSVIVTAPSGDDRFDFVSRFFAPKIGINEDPVTGSAHCYLSPFWEERLRKSDLVGHQVSARSGVVGCRRQGDRVVLWGTAVTILKGELVDA